VTKQSPSALWALRDDRTLSEHAKMAYVMLWTRLPDARPSMATLAGDMSVSVRTARDAVRELERADVLKTLPRVSESGDPDTNRYELTVLEGTAGGAAPPGTECRTGTAPPASKDNNPKKTSEGRKSQASRRAQPAVSRRDKIAFARIAVAESYGRDEAEELSDGKAEGLWDNLIGDRSPRDPVAYFCKIFTETPYLDTHLAGIAPDEDEPW
jgi:hypothetical protein